MVNICGRKEIKTQRRSDRRAGLKKDRIRQDE